MTGARILRTALLEDLDDNLAAVAAEHDEFRLACREADEDGGTTWIAAHDGTLVAAIVPVPAATAAGYLTARWTSEAARLRTEAGTGHAVSFTLMRARADQLEDCAHELEAAQQSASEGPAGDSLSRIASLFAVILLSDGMLHQDAEDVMPACPGNVAYRTHIENWLRNGSQEGTS